MKTRPKTWNNIKKFDDIVTKQERKIISDLGKHIKKEDIRVCPHLRKEGKFFYYCGLNIEDVDKKPSPTNPTYQAHVPLIEMQLFCMDNFRGCIYFREYFRGIKGNEDEIPGVILIGSGESSLHIRMGEINPESLPTHLGPEEYVKRSLYPWEYYY